MSIGPGAAGGSRPAAVGRGHLGRGAGTGWQHEYTDDELPNGNPAREDCLMSDPAASSRTTSAGLRIGRGPHTTFPEARRTCSAGGWVFPALVPSCLGARRRYRGARPLMRKGDGPSSNGRTPVFGTGGGGSSPPGPTEDVPEIRARSGKSEPDALRWRPPRPSGLRMDVRRNPCVSSLRSRSRPRASGWPRASGSIPRIAAPDSAPARSRRTARARRRKSLPD